MLAPQAGEVGDQRPLNSERALLIYLSHVIVYSMFKEKLLKVVVYVVGIIFYNKYRYVPSCLWAM